MLQHPYSAPAVIDGQMEDPMRSRTSESLIVLPLLPDSARDEGARLREFVIKEQAKFKELVERSGATVQ